VNPSGGYVQLTDDEVDRESPHTAPVDASATAAVFVRQDGVYRTVDGQQGGGQSAGTGLLVLEEVQPNPTHGWVTVCWQVPNEGPVTLKVYNSAGQLVRTLSKGTTKPGHNITVWDCRDDVGRKVAQGIYVVRLEAGGKSLAAKTVVVK